MPTVHLTERALIDVAGPDAEHFLQNVLTPDLAALPDGAAGPGALLTPQGKILFAFLICRTGKAAFMLEAGKEDADAFIKRLTLYRLRAKADISMRDQHVVAVSWQDDSTSSDIDSGARDMRFPETAGVCRHYDDLPPADSHLEDWDRLRIVHGVAEIGADFESAEAFPHDVLMDQNGGVGLKKGCFVGQEVVSRMQHRGTARRRVMIVEGARDLPPAGTAVRAGGRTLGALGSTAGAEGLAILRIDRVKNALDAGEALTAGDVPLAVTIPAWAHYTLPENAAGTGET